MGVVSSRPRALDLSPSPAAPLELYTPNPRAATIVMADVAYTAADERLRDARRAGLQAKKDEQPANIARSYRSKQEEWKARGPLPPSPLLPLICIRAYGLIRSSIDLVPDAAGGPRRLAL